MTPCPSSSPPAGPAAGRALLLTVLFSILAPLPRGHPLAPGALQAQVVVRGTSPATVTLEAGGAGVELVVQGSGLDQVRSAEATLGGRTLPGVVSVVVSRSAREVRLTLTAEAGTPGVTGARVVLISLRERVETPAALAIVAPSESAGGDAPSLPPQPVTATAGAFVARIAAPEGGDLPPDPVSREVGTFAARVAAPASTAPPEPTTRAVGTFLVVIAPPGGDHEPPPASPTPRSPS